MKKDCKTKGLDVPGIWYQMRKMLIMIKLCVLILLMSLFSAGASVFSQNSKLNLDYKNVTLNDVLEAIEDQSEFRFAFSSEYLDLGRKVSVRFENESVTTVLDNIFKETGVKYSIKERVIILYKDEPSGSRILQQTSVSGKVTDSSGRPLPGVTIVLKGTTQGTITDADGKYSLSDIPANSVLVFSFVGMRKQEIEVGSRSTIAVTMEEETIGLEEVVAIGYGTIQKKDLTGAVSQIKSEDFMAENPNDVTDLLRGNVTGLNIGYSTTPKGVSEMEIRGKTTLNANSAPLVVVDGIIYNGDLSDVNPGDIERVDVLKDASSAAVFGARATNGVVIITTKRGGAAKPTINFNANIGLSTMAVDRPVYSPSGYTAWRHDLMESMYPNMPEYYYSDPGTLPSSISLDTWKGYDGSTGDETTIWLNRLSLQPIEIENYKKGKSVNWYDMIFQAGLRQDYNISLSGKKDELSYYWSIGYTNNEGIIYNDSFNTIRSRLNVEGKVNDYITIGVNSQFANRDESAVPAYWQQAEYCSPWGSEYDDEGNLRPEGPMDDSFAATHPYKNLWFTDQSKIYNTLLASIYANVKLPFGFTYELKFNNRFEWYQYFQHKSAKAPGWEATGGEAFREHQKIYEWQIDNIIRWNKTIHDIHKFDLTLLANAEKYRSWYDLMENSNFDPNDELGYHDLEAGVNPVISTNDEYSTGDAYMARLLYSLKSRYLLTLSIRRDGYSAFGLNNPRATFPSAAFAWVLSDENFLKVPWIDYAKLRLSWGSNGNREIGRYSALSDISSEKYLLADQNGNSFPVSSLYINNMGNKDLKWERTTAYNVGLDFGILKNKIEGTVEGYFMTTTDLLVQRSLPEISGYAYVWDNLGKVQNKGLEVSLQSRNISSKQFSWNTDLNFSFNRNKIVHLYGDMEDVTDEYGTVIGQKESDDIANKWFIGHAIDEVWGMKQIGVWQSNETEEAAKYGVRPGDFKVLDVNGDGFYTNEDRVFQGYTTPRFRWTLRNSFTIFHDLNFSFMFYSYIGHIGEDNSAKNRGYFDRRSSYVLPYWTEENPTNKYARLYSSDGSADFNVYRKKTFIRLQNVSLSYNVPKTLLNKAQIEKMNIYFNIKNALLWTKEWELWDTENSEPTPRYFTLGIDLTL